MARSRGAEFAEPRSTEQWKLELRSMLERHEDYSYNTRGGPTSSAEAIRDRFSKLDDDEERANYLRGLYQLSEEMMLGRGEWPNPQAEQVIFAVAVLGKAWNRSTRAWFSGRFEGEVREAIRDPGRRDASLIARMLQALNEFEAELPAQFWENCRGMWGDAVRIQAEEGLARSII